jgi:hypothetical protein
LKGRRDGDLRRPGPARNYQLRHESALALDDAGAFDHTVAVAYGEQCFPPDDLDHTVTIVVAELLTQAVASEGKAESCFTQAIDVARSQSAKSWELRAAMSLSSLWQKQGKKDDARRLLAEIFGWFTEGFETADLKALCVRIGKIDRLRPPLRE